MTRLIEILISFAIVFALFVVVGIFLPQSRHLSESVETNRKMTIVYDVLNSTRRFTDWNPILLHDPAAKITRTGPDSGVGATFTYASNERGVGSGSWAIKDTVPGEKVGYAIETSSPGANKRSDFLLKRVGNHGRNVRVTETYDVDYGFNPIGRYAGLYVSTSVGEDIKLGLGRLTNMLASIPNLDYGQMQTEFGAPTPTLTPRPAETLLFVSATVENDFDKIKSQMHGNQDWIKKVIEANGLTATGPVRIITTESGASGYNFDLAVPVTKAGATGKIEGIKLEGPVKVAYNDAGRVVTTTFKGHMANLAKLRDSLRAWALTHGYDVADRPYEIWTGGVDPGFTNDGQYTVQWAIK